MVAAAITIANMIDGLSIYPPISYKDYLKVRVHFVYSYDMWLKKNEINNLMIIDNKKGNSTKKINYKV